MTAVHEHTDPSLSAFRGVISHMREASFPTPATRLQAGLQTDDGHRLRLFFGEEVSPDALESFEEVFYTYSDDVERARVESSVAVVGEFRAGDDGVVDTSALFVVDLELETTSRVAGH